MKTTRDAIKMLDTMIALSKKNLRGATGSERERIWSEIQGMEERKRELQG